MAGLLLNRIGQVILVMFGASILVFLMIRVLPGDPVLMMLGEYATAEKIEQVREDMGLNQPLHVQYLTWTAKLLRGDFGRSFRNGELISRELSTRLPATAELGLIALAVGSLFGIMLGVIAAIKKGSFWDHGVMLVAVAGIAVPVFWIGLLLLMVFTVVWPVLPVGGRVGVLTSLPGPTGFVLLDGIIAWKPQLVWEGVRHLILPVVSLASYPAAAVARVTRSSMLEVLNLDYIRTARAKGVRMLNVVMRHALRNALIPIVTIIGLSIGPVIGGAVLTETVFGWPGLGRYTVAAITSRDFPAVQAIVFLSALVFAATNVLVDLAYMFINPQVRN